MPSDVSSSHAAAKELTSAEKKRLRDRRAQRTLRQRRDRQVKQLEQRVAECCQNHGTDGNQRLIELVKRLEEENRTLQHRQDQILRLLGSPKRLQAAASPELQLLEHHLQVSGRPDTDPLPSIYPEAMAVPEVGPDGSSVGAIYPIDPALTAPDDSFGRRPPQTPSVERDISPIVEPSITGVDLSCSGRPMIPVTRLLAQSPNDAAPVPEPVSSSSSMVGTSSPLSLERLPPLVPAWMLVPSDDDHQSFIGIATCPWLSRPDLITNCPDIPLPLDLLHGTRRNFLADQIHQSLRRLHCRDPEVLAMGWLVYVYAKWRVNPNPKAFARIPLCMRPVMGQLQKPHPSCLDQIVWARLRLNMMQHCPQEKLLDVFALLSCCLKVRWVWGESILERDEHDTLRICPEFFETFITAEGWGITPEFIETHPTLVEGIEMSQMRYIPA